MPSREIIAVARIGLTHGPEGRQPIPVNLAPHAEGEITVLVVTPVEGHPQRQIRLVEIHYLTTEGAEPQPHKLWVFKPIEPLPEDPVLVPIGFAMVAGEPHHFFLELP